MKRKTLEKRMAHIADGMLKLAEKAGVDHISIFIDTDTEKPFYYTSALKGGERVAGNCYFKGYFKEDNDE